jgi:transposase
VVVDGQGIPLGSHTASASPAEITLLEEVMADIRVPKKGPGRPRTRPKRVIGDKAYDSDGARKRLRKRGINLLSPHRTNHRNVNRQDDRLWDRYKRRYIVERTFAWVGNYRRLVVRYENHISMFLAFLELGIAMLVLKKCL